MSMAGVKSVVVLAFIIAVSFGGKSVGAQVHHVVGGDRGWDSSSDVASWSSGRIFSVGDKIWFTYSAAQESIVELNSKEEYEACDISNPIRMYTDGIESISLDGEGIRYFASSKLDNCKDGLKLHVDVQPPSKSGIQTVASSERAAMAVAAGPTTPSASANLNAFTFLLVGLLIVSLINMYLINMY